MKLPTFCTLTCGFLFTIASASRIPNKFKTTVVESENTEVGHLGTSPVPGPKSLFDKLKIAFHQLPPETLNQLVEIYQYLNYDGLVDSFQTSIESLGTDSPVRLVPGFYTWLFTQEKEDVYRWVWTFDKCLKRFEKWLKRQRIWDNYEAFDDQLDDWTSPSSKEEMTPQEFVLDLVKILWRMGFDNIYRLGELIEYLDPGNARIIRMSIRLISVNMGISMALHSKQAREGIVPEMAEWILAQDPNDLRQWLEVGNSQLNSIFDWIDEQGY